VVGLRRVLASGKLAVCGELTIRNVIALPDQRAIMNRSFKKMGIIPVSAFYSVMKPGDPQSPRRISCPRSARARVSPSSRSELGRGSVL
jgi:hypothetical protein